MIRTQSSPEMLAAQQAAQRGAAGYLGQAAGGFNPDDYAANVSDRLRRLAAPAEEKARTGMENRLQAQGLLGSSIGGGRMGELLTAQSMAEEQRNLNALQQAEQVQNNMVSRGLALGQGAVALDPSQTLLGQSLKIGALEQGGRQAQFTGEMAGKEQLFGQRLAANQLELENQKAKVGQTNQAAMINAQRQYESDKLKADSSNAMFGGIMDMASGLVGGGGGGLFGGEGGWGDQVMGMWDNFWNPEAAGMISSVGQDLDLIMGSEDLAGGYGPLDLGL
jgi:hypothetical protein